MNRRERQVAEQYKAMGYEVYRNGWPDLVVSKDNKVTFIEVKSPEDKRRAELFGTPVLNPEQEKMHALLKSLGLEVVVKIVY